MCTSFSTLQLYDRHLKATNEGEERERFSKLTLEYMSEESSADEDGIMNVHKPAWRSNSKTLVLVYTQCQCQCHSLGLHVLSFFL